MRHLRYHAAGLSLPVRWLTHHALGVWGHIDHSPHSPENIVIPLRYRPSLRPLRDLKLPHALQNQTYRRYWLSQIVSLTGTWMQSVGSTLVVLTLTTSAFLIGLVNVVAALPMLLLMLSGGVVADRYDRRMILIVTQSLLALFALGYATLVALDVVAYWHILVLATLLGITASFELPASQAFVPELVGDEDLPQAIALNSAAFNASRLVGPAMAGAAISAFGLASAFLVNAASFLVVIAVLVSLRGLVVHRQSHVPGRAGGLREGLRHVRQRDDLLGLVLLTALLSLLVFPCAAVLLPLYVSDVLGGGPGWIGAVLSITGAGSLVGSLILLRGSRLERAADRRLRIALVGLTVGLLWLALARTPLAAVPGVAILGFAFAMGSSQIMTRVQQLAPDALRGRVMSIHGLAFTGTMPFATLLVTGAAELFGMPLVYASAALLTALGSVLIYRRFAHHAFISSSPSSPTIGSTSAAKEAP